MLHLGPTSYDPQRALRTWIAPMRMMLLVEVGGVAKEGLVHERLAEQHLCVLVRPALGGERLEEHDDALEVHGTQLVRPLVQEDGADVQVKVGEGVGSLGEIGVPHADDVAHAHLAHEQAVHPSEGELHVLDALVVQVGMQRRIDACDQLAQETYLTLDAWLGKDVVVLDAIEQL
ncbi:hypothetical protein L1887_62780 [Cichorium endivia]|nr:hypothetical protein L1887_62780 [Cichorium endivia]